MDAVAITGLGLVCALGPDLAHAWPRLVAGEHGIRRIARFDAAGYAAHLAAEVPEFNLGPALVAGEADVALRRGARLFLAAAREAWRDARLDGVASAASAGVAVGTSVNYLHMGQLREHWDARAGRPPAAPRSSFFRRQGDTFAAAAAIELGLAGPRLTLDTACAAGAHAIVDAFRLVSRGDVPAMLAGAGSGLIVPVTLLAFGRLGALSPARDPAAASRPFDRRRDGFVLGEGAAAVVLEPLHSARARRAHVYAELAGAATTTNAHSLTDPSPGGETEAATIAAALADAGLSPETVDYVAAHGTSTPKNDVTETLALKRALGDRARAIAVSSHKGQLGHTLPAAGAINVVVAAMALATQTVPPTANLAEPDPDCDLDYVPGQGRPAAIRVALAHAFGFGGQNVVLVLRRAAETATQHEELDGPGDDRASIEAA